MSKSNASTVVVHDSKLANVAGHADRLAILRKLNAADSAQGSALIDALRMTATFGPTSKDEVAEGYPRCASPAVYASTFNRGAKCAAVIGIAKTVKLIDGFASDGKPGAYGRAVDALGNVCTQAETAGTKTLAPKQATDAVKVAVAFAAAAKVAKVAAKRGTPLVRRDAAQVKLATAAIESSRDVKGMAAFVKLASGNAHKLAETEGRETLHRQACAALATACELWQQLAK